jgi:hypothetical protein
VSWGHAAIQRALLAELQKQQQAIDTMSLLRIICDGDNPTHAQGQSARRALHIYDAKYPTAPSATLKPPDALVADYKLLQQRIGTTRNVVVTPLDLLGFSRASKKSRR